MRSYSRFVSRAAIAAALAAVAISATGVWADSAVVTAPGYAVISLSGSTALKNFITASGNGALSLEPSYNFSTSQYSQTSITFSNGTYYSAANSSGQLNLAPTTYSSSNLANGSTGPGLLVEWHEQGSVEGIYEMAQDQLGPKGWTAPTLATSAPRYPTNSNPIHINGSGPTISPSAGLSQKGFTWNGATTVQDPVTMAMSDVNAVQGFSVPGSVPTGTAPYAAKPQTPGYGQGNPLFASNANALGTANMAAQMISNTALTVNGTNYYNSLESTTIAKTASLFVANPGTGLTRLNQGDAQFLETTSRLANGVSFNFTSRDVNSGTRNVTALDTGIDPSWAVGKNDAGNGNAADGYSAQTFIGSGLKFSNKTAGGNELRPTIQNARMAVGTLSLPDFGGGGAGVGGADPLRALDYGNDTSDANIATPANVAMPNAVDANGVVSTPGKNAQWARASLQNIMTGAYTISQNESFVDFSNGSGGILGDTKGDTQTLKTMVTASVGLFPSGTFNGPAATLVQKGYLPLALCAVNRTTDGSPLVTNNSTNFPSAASTSTFKAGLAWSGAQGENAGSVTSPNSDSILGTPAFNNANFTVGGAAAGPGTVTGAGSAYGEVTGSTTLSGGATAVAVFVDKIKITGTLDANNNLTSGNTLVGNFNQTGSRDLAAVETAVFAQQALHSADASNSSLKTDTSLSNSTTIDYTAAQTAMNTATNIVTGISLNPLKSMVAQTSGTTGANKGDLIVMGDVNGDGKFDGKDIYLLAHGAAVSDASGTTYSNGTLTLAAYNSATGVGGFGDAIRTATLRKNTALDFCQANCTTAQKTDARAVLSNYLTALPTGATQVSFTAVNGQPLGTGTYVYTYDPTGAAAFDKCDVNHDGKVDRSDAQTIDAEMNKDYTSLSDQLGVTITDATGAQQSLADCVLADGHTTVQRSDFNILANRLISGGVLLKGDCDFSGKVDGSDLAVLITNWQKPVTQWSKGDFEGTGVVNGADLADLITNWQGSAGNIALPNDIYSALPLSLFSELPAGLTLTSVPEPASLGLLAIGAVALISRRRKA